MVPPHLCSVNKQAELELGNKKLTVMDLRATSRNFIGNFCACENIPWIAYYDLTQKNNPRLASDPPDLAHTAPNKAG